jgi:MmoB/DmpM family
MDQDVIEAMLIAIEDDNPDAEVLYEDHGGYVRIHTPWLRRVTRKSLAATLGRSFRLVDLEPSLSGFASGCATWAMMHLSGIRPLMSYAVFNGWLIGRSRCHLSATRN